MKSASDSAVKRAKYEPIFLSGEPSGSGSLLKRRSDEMKELWL